MIIGLVSDTHGHVANTRSAIRLLESLGIAEVVHCGDIGSPDIIGLFTAWPTHFVFGNVDSDERPLRAAMRAAGSTCHDQFGSAEWLGKKVAFLHGHDTRRLAETIANGKYDLVCHGHTHLAAKTQQGSTLVVNPGALFRANPHTLAIVSFPEMEVTHMAI